MELKGLTAGNLNVSFHVGLLAVCCVAVFNIVPPNSTRTWQDGGGDPCGDDDFKSSKPLETSIQTQKTE